MKQVLAALLVLSVGAALTTGCDFTEGHDVDPNLATEAPPGLILPAGQLGVIQTTEGDLARTAAMWAGHLVGSDRQFFAQQSGTASSEDWNNAWNTAYADALAPLRMAGDAYAEVGNRIAAGIARTNEALVWGTMTSLFGSIPFSQALQPLEFPTPEFDAQQAVYDGIQAMLSTAIADLESGTGLHPSRPDGSNADLFDLNAAQWARVAHTLTARYALHTGDYARAVTHAQQGILPGGDMVAPHSTSVGARNLWWTFVVQHREGNLAVAPAHGTAYTARLLFPGTAENRENEKTDETARRQHLFTGETLGEAGMATTGTGFFAQPTDYPIVTHLENELILAEARLFAGNFSATAQQEALDALNSARAELAEQFPEGQYDAYVLADFAPGGIANPQGETQGRALLREILEEKQVSLFGNIEAYNDIRRTENFLGINLPIVGDPPQRYLYGIGEVNANPNVPSPIPGLFTVTPVNAALDYAGPVPN